MVMCGRTKVGRLMNRDRVLEEGIDDMSRICQKIRGVGEVESRLGENSWRGVGGS